MKRALSSLLVLLVLSGTASFAGDLENQVADLQNKVADLEKKIEQLNDRIDNCRVESEYRGRYLGWCPSGSYVGDISITTSGSANNVWVSCYSPRLVCKQ